MANLDMNTDIDVRKVKALRELTVLEDGGGYITIATDSFIHEYTEPKHAAEDTVLILEGADTSEWDGDEPELRATLEEAEAGNDNGCTLLYSADLQDTLSRGADHNGGNALREYVDILAHDTRLSGLL
jgi:hypothetical protein